MIFLHKLSFKLVKAYDNIFVEDLNVKGIVKNRCLAKAVPDVGIFEFVRQLIYKCEWYGKKLSKLDRWFPSTKTCSACGKKHQMKLSDRQMNCSCGVDICRDLNAAINIKVEGIRSLNV